MAPESPGYYRLYYLQSGIGQPYKITAGWIAMGYPLTSNIAVPKM